MPVMVNSLLIRVAKTVRVRGDHIQTIRWPLPDVWLPNCVLLAGREWPGARMLVNSQAKHSIGCLTDPYRRITPLLHSR